MTEVRNRETKRKEGEWVHFDFYDDGAANDELFEFLVYATYQVPRLLFIAHGVWFECKVSNSSSDSREFGLQLFELEARIYYPLLGKIWEKFEYKDMAHIALSCGVHFPVWGRTNVPGTNISWEYMIGNSLVFPYLDDCYVLPLELIWKSLDDDYVRDKLDATCAGLVNNLDVTNLFMAYSSICHLPI